MAERIATVNRITKETSIKLTLNLDGTGKCRVDSGIPFLDHMLQGFARHGLFDLEAEINGDIHIDSHHTVEDTGIVLGDVIRKAVGDKVGIKRFGSAVLPMDDALVLCAIDLSGRPYFSFDCEYTTYKLGDLETEMIHDFFYAISYSSAMNLHIKKISGFNNHHVAEGTFKAFGKALDMATMIDSRITGVLSTKGKL
ncbi:MAG: imidazoleglycerol-phosphate dehydratase HisB [Lachnospiraceae bacterium]|jgi:imidazoleglycerol-phosphate dehydratase|nr:imidazoleglycerol-phosphate dehydratase HisB [Lachnospiraceae bacterium]